MTVSSTELAEVCSRLMDISMQLLAAVKELEKSTSQVAPCISSCSLYS